MYLQRRDDVEGIFTKVTKLVRPDLGGVYQKARAALQICQENHQFIRAQFNNYNEKIDKGISVEDHPLRWPERSQWEYSSCPLRILVQSKVPIFQLLSVTPSWQVRSSYQTPQDAVDTDVSITSQPSGCGSLDTGLVIVTRSRDVSPGFYQHHSYLYVDYLHAVKVIFCDGDVYPSIAPSEDFVEPLYDEEWWEYSYKTLEEACHHTRRPWFVSSEEKISNFWDLPRLKFKLREPNTINRR